MLKEDLLKLGLGQNEVSVYLGLIGKGRVRAGLLIKESGLHRNIVYQALDALAERRLITKTLVSGVAEFQTADVEHVKDAVREQELVADRVIQTLKQQARLTDQEITVYEGDAAIRTFCMKFVNTLSAGECVRVLGSGGQYFEDAMGPSFEKYFQLLGTRGANTVILKYAHQIFSENRQKIQKKYPWIHVGRLPIDLAPSLSIVITDTIVGFQIFESPQSVIEIRNPHLVAAYKKYFEALNSQQVRVEQGIDALRAAFTDMIDGLKPGEEYYVLGGNLGREYERMTSFFDEIHRYRISRGVVANILAQNESAENIRERNRRAGDPEEKISHVKTFNTPFLAPMQINMVKGRAYMVLYKEGVPTVVYFDDSTVYDGFKLYFDEIWNRTVETLHGEEGVKQLCERVLEEGKSFHMIGVNGSILKRYPEYYGGFTRRRVEKKMHQHMLVVDEARRDLMTVLPLSDGAYLPKGFASPMVIWVFGDTVAHVLWHEPETIFMMNDARTAGYYRQYFDALLKISEKELS